MSITSSNNSILSQRLAQNKSKTKKRRNEEDNMLKKAIVCLDKVTNEDPERWFCNLWETYCI